MTWSNFWRNAPIGTVLTVSPPSGAIGRVNYTFVAEIGYQKAVVPISDTPGRLDPGRYQKNLLGEVIFIPTEA